MVRTFAANLALRAELEAEDPPGGSLAMGLAGEARQPLSAKTSCHWHLPSLSAAMPELIERRGEVDQLGEVQKNDLRVAAPEAALPPTTNKLSRPKPGRGGSMRPACVTRD